MHCDKFGLLLCSNLVSPRQTVESKEDNRSFSTTVCYPTYRSAGFDACSRGIPPAEGCREVAECVSMTT
jgi:hypothetical protein